MYNLDVDPSEQFDLAADRPEVVAALTRIADEHRKSVVPGPDQLQQERGGTGRGGR